MRSHAVTARTHAPPVVNDVLRTPGRPLEPSVRGEMEGRFGHDFSRVRVHTDGRAAESARAVNASAFTMGSDVVFGAGRYAPTTPGGSRLLAHELAHTIQQRGATAERSPIAPSSALESAAASAGHAVSTGRAVTQPLGTSGLALARETDDERAKAIAEAEAAAGRVGQQLAEADTDDEPTQSTLPPVPSRFLPGGFTEKEADALGQEAESRVKLGSLALTLAERQARRREFWARNPGNNSADVKEAFDLDLYWDPKEEGFIRQPYVDKWDAIVDADPEARDLYRSRYSDLMNKPAKKSRFKRTMDFVCKYTDPCSSNLEQYRQCLESGRSRDDCLNRGMARLVVAAETMVLPTPGPSGPIKVGPGGRPTGMPFDVPATEGPSLGGAEPLPAGPITPKPTAAPTSKPLLTTGSGKPPPGKVEPPKPSPAAQEPAPAPPAPLTRPGTVTVEASVQNGLVRPGGKLEGTLQAIQAEFTAAPPTNLNQAMGVVGRGTAKVGLAQGIKSPGTAGEIVLKNVGGVETRVFPSGEIIVINKAGQVVLHLIP